MNKTKALKLIKLLAAMEAWSFASGSNLPDYLQDDLSDAIDRLTEIVLERSDMGQSSRAAISDISGA